MFKLLKYWFAYPVKRWNRTAYMVVSDHNEALVAAFNEGYGQAAKEVECSFLQANKEVYDKMHYDIKIERKEWMPNEDAYCEYIPCGKALSMSTGNLETYTRALNSYGVSFVLHPRSKMIAEFLIKDTANNI